AVYAMASPDTSSARAVASDDGLLSKVRFRRPEIGHLLADWLRGVRCRDNAADAIAARAQLHPGEAFVTPHGHLVSAQGIALFAPDSELHGVLERQRELAELEPAIGSARSIANGSANALAEITAELERAQHDYHAESLAYASQQRRCHDLELEL